MFVKVTDNPLPKLYPEVVRKDPTISDPGFVEIGGFRLRDNIDYCPQIGLQEECIKSDADIIFMGGSASSGKTFTIMLDALRGVGKQGYTGSIISKRLIDSGKGSSIGRDFRQIFENFAGFDVTLNSGITVAYSDIFKNSIRLLHANFNTENPKEWVEFQEYSKKIQSSYISFDELTDCTFRMFIYFLSRNRDSSGMRPRMLASLNPSFEHWTRTWLDWYICPDTHLVVPERNGVMRYLYVGAAKSAGDIIWGNTKEEVLQKVNIPLSKKDVSMGLKPEDFIKSFVFLTAEPSENKILVNKTGGGSISNLMNSGDAERLKFGYWGPVESYETAISDTMIRRIFTNPIDNDTTMRATIDLSAGGKDGDLCVIGIWKGTTLIHIEQSFFYNDPASIRHWISRVLNDWKVDVKNMAFDASGLGFFMREFKNGIPILGNSKQLTEYDEAGNISKSGDFRTLRSQLMGKLEALIMRGEISCAIDKDMKFEHGRNKQKKTLENILIDEKEVFKKSVKDGKIYYASKDDFKSKHSYSPDITDLFMMFSIFMLDMRARKQEEEEFDESDYYF